ncbi:BTB/POZ domain-containing protein 6-B isoform X3 [Hemiscyllium ocellatum]|uniref:BTB/POZ domain-containing protein 6-B isoform X3 n=1 Tax=Hemiscyllium ocellatum TaxID=170820 RepID=UPI00296618E0|nr:BTB/POZ domain-containing protein 6-B isoform X3 [Hemiscyllium ocellatum]
MLLVKYIQETLRKPKSVKRESSGSKLPACYEIVTLSLGKKMAAELYPSKHSSNSSLQSSENSNSSSSGGGGGGSGNTVSSNSSSSKRSFLLRQGQQQNLNNNHIQNSNWQSFYPTLRERNAMMYNNELMADVHFIVGPPGCTQRVPAHKYILAVGSSVFYAMFYGELAEDKPDIHIPDVEPAAFLILLKCCLTCCAFPAPHLINSELPEKVMDAEQWPYSPQMPATFWHFLHVTMGIKASLNRRQTIQPQGTSQLMTPIQCSVK